MLLVVRNGLLIAFFFHLASRSAVPSPVPAPSQQALRHAASLVATIAGVDHRGNLWGWDREDGHIEVVTPDGASTRLAPVLHATTVDVDRDWGIVSLTEGGSRLQYQPASSSGVSAFELSRAAGNICWVDSRTVAVSPLTGAHRVELWDISTATRIGQLGPEDPIVQRVGVVLGRAVLLRMDHARARLHTFDAFAGSLKVFSLDGTIAWHARIENRDRERVLRWLESIEEGARARNEKKLLEIYSWSAMAVDTKGNTLIIDRCRRSEGEIDILRIKAGGGTEPVILASGECCAGGLVAWSDFVLVHSDPAAPAQRCAAIGRVP